jgi:putative heme-binding domain-containing protein
MDPFPGPRFLPQFRGVKTLIVFVMAVASAAAQAPKANPLAGDPKAAEEGRVAFRGSCSPCHGIKGEGGRGPDLTVSAYATGTSDADLYNVIANGVTGTEMAGFAARFESDDIWRLVSYVRSIAGSSSNRITGNVGNGERLFWNKGQCGQCHMVNGRGKRMGPELTQVGRQRSTAYLRESVVNPGADLTPGFATITVVTKDGKKIVGTQRGYDDFSAQLMDGAENYYSFQKSDVESITLEYKSLMPNTFVNLFSEPELNDLVAYMASLRGARR